MRNLHHVELRDLDDVESEMHLDRSCSRPPRTAVVADIIEVDVNPEDMDQDRSQHPDEPTTDEYLTPPETASPPPVASPAYLDRGVIREGLRDDPDCDFPGDAPIYPKDYEEPEFIETTAPFPSEMETPIGDTLRHNQGKPQLSYILEFGEALELIAQVMEKGAETYERGNWKLGGKNTELASLLDSTMRHLTARMGGEVHDEKMGTDHLANAACGILFALWHHGQRPEGD